MPNRGKILFVILSAVILFVSVSYAQDDLFEKGRRAYLKRDYETAVRYLSEYVAGYPDSRAYYLLGYARYELLRKTGSTKGRRNFWGDTQAARYFREAYLIDPDISARSAEFKKK